jgi:hypothetical protein
MTEGRGPDGILHAVTRAEHLRRRRLVTRALLRVGPAAAGALLVTAALVRLAHLPLAVFWTALALLLVAVAVFAVIKGRVPAITDSSAAKIDADAGLAGELRSAHWFASHPEADPWTTFHVDRASQRVESVSWPAVYPPISTARAWAGSGVLAAAAIAVVLTSAWPLAKGTNAVNAKAAAGKNAAGIPTDLQNQIDELLKAVQNGSLPMDAARMKLADLRNALANLDPKTQAAMAKAAADAMKNGGKDAGKDDPAKSLADRAEKAAANPSLPQDMKWSMEDLASKLKYAGMPQEKNEGESGQEAKAPNSNQQNQQGDAKPGDAAMQMTRTTATDAQSSQMMASTMSPMASERGPNGEQKKGKTGEPLDLKGAMRKETIEADSDTQGTNVLAELRKKSEQQHSTLGFSRVAPLAAYDKSHAAPPPPPSDAVRPLLKQYFIRR